MANFDEQQYYYGQQSAAYGWGDVNQEGSSYDIDANFGQEQ